jgi:hypothetical protein
MLYALTLLFPAVLLLTNGIDIADGNDATSPAIGIAMIVASLCLFGVCGLVLRGGWHLLTLEKYSAALLGSFLGQPIGLWGLFVLGRPEVKAAFAVQPRRSEIPAAAERPRLSRKAIFGAIWAALFFFVTLAIVVPASYYTMQLQREQEAERRARADAERRSVLAQEHEHSEAALPTRATDYDEPTGVTGVPYWTLLLFPVILAPFGTTILGMNAVLFPTLLFEVALCVGNYYVWAATRTGDMIIVGTIFTSIFWVMLGCLILWRAWRIVSRRHT